MPNSQCPTCGCQFNRYEPKSLQWQVCYQLAYDMGVRDWTRDKRMKLRDSLMLRFWKAYEKGYSEGAGKMENKPTAA